MSFNCACTTDSLFEAKLFGHTGNAYTGAGGKDQFPADAEAVRFNVAREKLADQTAYSVLRIVRELVINAIRHGKASKVRIAGSLDDGTLRFSVTDDGCGFNPDACPGVAQGHFGIEGIRERVDQLGGTFDLTSAPGRGTKAVITLASFEEP